MVTSMFEARNVFLADQLALTPTLFAELITQSKALNVLLDIPPGSSRLMGKAYDVLRALELQLPDQEKPDEHLEAILMPLFQLLPEAVSLRLIFGMALAVIF
jgi:hypothetical protein